MMKSRVPLIVGQSLMCAAQTINVTLFGATGTGHLSVLFLCWFVLIVIVRDHLQDRRA